MKINMWNYVYTKKEICLHKLRYFISFFGMSCGNENQYVEIGTSYGRRNTLQKVRYILAFFGISCGNENQYVEIGASL